MLKHTPLSVPQILQGRQSFVLVSVSVSVQRFYTQTQTQTQCGPLFFLGGGESWIFKSEERLNDYTHMYMQKHYFSCRITLSYKS